MKGIFKRTFVLFLVCALFLTGGVLQVAMADQGLQCPPPPKTYKVSYEYEYERGISEEEKAGFEAVPGTVEYAKNTPVTVALNPTKTGYWFTGWSTRDVDVKNGGFKMPDHSVKFVGKWCKVPMYAVTYEYEYDRNISDEEKAGLPALPATGEYAKNTPVTVAVNPAKTGYRFTGWSTHDVDVKNGGFDMPNHSVKFVGKWCKVPMYAVTYEYEYDRNIGDEEKAVLPTLPGMVEYEKNAPVTVAANPTKAGYQFTGWSTRDVHVRDGGFKMPEHSVTFIGKWTATDYFVTYAFGGEVMPPNVTKPTDDSVYHAGVDVPVLVPGGDYTGFTFSGWKMEDGTLVSGTFPMPAKNVTLTGSFDVIPPDTYGVTYTFVGEVIPPNATAPEDNITYLAGASVPVLPPEGSYEGFTFSGWKLGDASVGETFEMPIGGAALTGSWQKNTVDPPVNPPVVVIPAYYVTYTYAGVVPSGAPAVPTLSAYFVGSSVKVAPVPQLAGYSFSGWVTADVTVVNGVFAQPYKDVTFTGSWVRGSARVPNTGEAQMLLLPGIFLAAGVALAAAAFTIRSKRRGR